MKICSFLPSGTEIVCALGLGQNLVGVSHECDYPPQAKGKPVVVRGAAPTEELSAAEIDKYVSEKMKSGESLYVVDTDRLKELAPDVIITQDLCQVCAPSGPEAKKALAVVPASTKVLYLSPHSLEDVFANIRSVGEATGTLDKAKELIYQLRLRAVNVQTRAFRIKKKPKVFVLEWLDPPFNAGHWVPDMVEIAGGAPDMAAAGKDSVRVTWDRVREFNPDVLIVSPCGYHLDRALKEAEILKRYPYPDITSAFRNGRVYAVDADSYLSRPGPRVVDGIDLLAHILHPDAFDWKGPSQAYERVSL
jgi:iron complex transport system substrate-binding protein